MAVWLFFLITNYISHMAVWLLVFFIIIITVFQSCHLQRGDGGIRFHLKRISRRKFCSSRHDSFQWRHSPRRDLRTIRAHTTSAARTQRLRCNPGSSAKRAAHSMHSGGWPSHGPAPQRQTVPNRNPWQSNTVINGGN